MNKDAQKELLEKMWREYIAQFKDEDQEAYKSDLKLYLSIYRLVEKFYGNWQKDIQSYLRLSKRHPFRTGGLNRVINDIRDFDPFKEAADEQA